MMPSTAQEAYLESEVLCADGIELVRMLYRAALESVEKARRHLRRGDIAARSKEITRAIAILTELALSVDHAAGGALSRTLAELYDYMQRRLIEANVRQTEPPLADVAKLLATLLEAWLQCGSPAPSWTEARPPIPADASPGDAPQSWTF